MSIVATYHSAGGQGRKKKGRPLMKKTHGVATNVYLRKTLEKIERGYVHFENKGSGVVYA